MQAERASASQVRVRWRRRRARGKQLRCAAPASPSDGQGSEASPDASDTSPCDVRERVELVALVERLRGEVKNLEEGELAGLDMVNESLWMETHADVQEAMEDVQELAEQSSSLRNTSALREGIWRLRCALERRSEVMGGSSLGVRRALEALRAAALDTGTPRSEELPPSHYIPNFVPVYDEDGRIAFFRGGQPTAQGRKWLAENGVRTVVDLRASDRWNQWGDEHELTKQDVVDIMPIPIEDLCPPTLAQAWQFISIANDASRRKMYVHCKAGIGRTGAVVACWRISRGLTADEALQHEAICGAFGTFRQEDFVRSFFAALKAPAAFIDAPPLSPSPSSSEASIRDSSSASGASSDAESRSSSFDEAPDIYLVRTDNVKCTRELLADGVVQHAHPSTQSLSLVWRKPPRCVLVLKKLGVALLPQLAQAAAILLRQNMVVLVEDHVLLEMDALVGDEEQETSLRDVVRAVRKRVQRLLVDDEIERPERYKHSQNAGKKLQPSVIASRQAAAINSVVCIGGDGVLLHAAQLFQGPVPMVMSFHFGSMGFLTNFPPDEMKSGLRMLAGPQVSITLRMRLECEIRRGALDGPLDGTFQVLNEVLVERGPSPFLCKLNVCDRGRFITTIAADGVLIATPTGSTAYSVAAGGSIVHPSLSALLLTPICPHTLSFRPVILPDSSVVELHCASDARSDAWVSFDGKHRSRLGRGDAVVVRMSKYCIPTVNRSKEHTEDFFVALDRCLHWNERQEQQSFDEATARSILKSLGESVPSKSSLRGQ
mmetsp:Transcript_14948/g.49001  ORF Transcript_14948/g.49001 Transcript_14948/m.49001 type:complete len:776 (-) Transcript_14948:1422-3749(-)